MRIVLLLLAGLAGCGRRAELADAAPECVAVACAGRTFFCLPGNTYQATEEVGCHESCGPEPCTGATCRGTGPSLSCPGRTTCTNERAADSPCVKLVPDAGPDRFPVPECFPGGICPITPPYSPPDADPDVQVATAQEGQACSASPVEDPQLVCAAGVNLICVSTYSVKVGPDGGARSVYLCRQPCTTSGECHAAGDVCCPAMSARACAPLAFCDHADGGP